jgi:hypothetical protein
MSTDRLIPCVGDLTSRPENVFAFHIVDLSSDGVGWNDESGVKGEIGQQGVP